MKQSPTLTGLVAGLLLLSGCGQEPQTTARNVEPATPAAPAPQPYVVELRAVGKTFEGPPLVQK